MEFSYILVFILERKILFRRCVYIFYLRFVFIVYLGRIGSRG